MTRLRILSDLHLEFGPLELEPAGEDVIVLAGDIDVGEPAIAWADETARRLGVPVVEIAGNHEFYHGRRIGSHQAVLEKLCARAAASEGRVTFLENAVATISGVRFIGATLWTDFKLNGDDLADYARRCAERGLTDYRTITFNDGAADGRSWDGSRSFTPDDSGTLHAASQAFVAAALASPVAGPTVVVGHMAPSSRSIHPRFHNLRDADLNPCYASNLDALVAGSGAALWVHGHTHLSFDYRIGATRVVCNPRGYAGHELNPEFDPNLIVEV